MSDAPVFQIDPAAFWADPYPDLARMRALAPMVLFGSANRDETVFARPDDYDLTRDVSAAISFGAGPHFCAGAWAAKALIADVALPMLFDRLPGLDLAGAASFGGWAFRGPLTVPVRWPV